MLQELREQLIKNPIQNMSVLGFFENYPLEKYSVYGESIILKGTSDYPWAFMAVAKESDLDILLEKFEYETLYFANVEDWMLPYLTKNFRIEWRLSTQRYYLPLEAPIEEVPENCSALKSSYAEFVYLNSPYKDFTSVAYIAERLEKDISAAYWVDGELVGWGFTHDDGSLGFLNVLSAYRGQGVGEKIFKSLIAQKREKRKDVFANVEPHNKQSIGLLTKLGMQEDRVVSWVKLA